MASRTFRIVAVDDDVPNLQLYRLLLERHVEGCTAVLFADPLEAFAYFQSEQADAALFDYDMPHLTGIQLAQAVRAIPRHAVIPMIMVSSRGDEELRNEARLRGIDAFVEKPFQSQALIRAVQSALRQLV